MWRAGLCFLLFIASGCAQDLFVVSPPEDGSQTEVYVVRTFDGSVRVIVHGVSDPSIELEEPEQVIVFRYAEPREEVAVWLEAPSQDSCRLLAGLAYELRLTEPPGFVPIEASDEEFDRLFPEWTSLCVTCRPFEMKSLLYPVPPADLDLVRTGGPHAELPSGAFLAAGADADAFFRVTENDAQPIEGRTDQRIRRLVRIGPRSYLAADGSSLRVLEIDEAETTLSFGPSLALEDASVSNVIVEMVVASSTSSLDILVIDANSRLLRSDLTSWELVTSLPIPADGWLEGPNLLVLDRDHFLLAASWPTLYEYNAGRLRQYTLERGKVAALASIPGFGVLVGDSYGEVFEFEDGAFRPLGMVDNEDDVDALLPYRGGFLAVSKGGFIDAYAPHIERFCDVSTSIPGAQNAALSAWTRVPNGFFCSDCLQSRSGGAYGAAWFQDQ